MSTEPDTAPAKLVAAALGEIDSALEGLRRAWPMFAGSCSVDAARPVEFLAVELACLRATLSGRPAPDWRAWCYRRYPAIPGPVRCATEAATRKGGDFRDAFQAELTALIDDLGAEPREPDNPDHEDTP